MRYQYITLFFFSLCLTISCATDTAEPPQNTPTPSPPQETLSDTATFPTFTIDRINDCGINPTAVPQSLILFNQDENRLSGWNHIRSTSGEFSAIKQERTAYQIRQENSAPDPTCNNQQTFPAILVKKYADWDRQHANGIETQFLEEGIPFNQIESIVIELKLDSQNTSILTTAERDELYGAYVPADARDEWENGRAHLGLTLFEIGHDNQSSPSFNASTILEIDPAVYADQWIRLTIPADQLTYYTEQDWSSTPANLADFPENLVLGLRINPETTSGQVVRNFIPDQFNSNIPEQFKELSIVIKRIAITLQ